MTTLSMYDGSGLVYKIVFLVIINKVRWLYASISLDGS